MAAKARRRPDAPTPAPAAERVTLTLSAEAAERLRIHGAKSKERRGDVVSRLIVEHLRRWRVADMERQIGPALAVEAGESEAA